MRLDFVTPLALCIVSACTVTTTPSTTTGGGSKPAPGTAEEAPAESPGATPGPTGTIDSALVGRWYQGNLAATQVYDDVTGEWAPPNGTGIFYIFEPDGRYTQGGILNTSTGACTSQLLVQEKGTFESTDATLVTSRQSGRSFVDNNCGNDYERVLEPEEKTYGFRVVGTKLVLVWSDGSEDSFQRWQ